MSVEKYAALVTLACDSVEHESSQFRMPDTRATALITRTLARDGNSGTHEAISAASILGLQDYLATRDVIATTANIPTFPSPATSRYETYKAHQNASEYRRSREKAIGERKWNPACTRG